VRLADEVKPDTRAVQGDPQSKLVKDILSRQAEQEAANANPVVAEEEKSSAATAEADGKGGGIRLGRLRKTGTLNGRCSESVSKNELTAHSCSR